jgi:C4-dicarboxylate transporter DctQ subunit
MSTARYEPRPGLGAAVHKLEESLIALILGLMTLITFVNVILRYTSNADWRNALEASIGWEFPNSLLWGLETVLVLFAWLVLLGISYAFKITAHLGVDALLNVVSSRAQRIMTLITLAICIFYALLLLKGAWDYWAPFAGFQVTEGRWFPTGFDEGTRDQGWYETEQIPIPQWASFLEDWFNQGEEYEKLPRLIPYVMLPIGMALMLFRIVQVSIRVVQGKQSSIIVSHEAEDAVEDVAALNRES